MDCFTILSVLHDAEQSRDGKSVIIILNYAIISYRLLSTPSSTGHVAFGIKIVIEIIISDLLLVHRRRQFVLPIFEIFEIATRIKCFSSHRAQWSTDWDCLLLLMLFDPFCFKIEIMGADNERKWKKMKR